LVQRSVTAVAAVLLTAVLAPAALPGAAGATIAWSACGDSNVQACGHLTVPLDPAGGGPGEITLALRRQRAPVGEAKDAVIALAGGPGQAAIPFTSDFSALLGPILSTRDLIVLDQRGTGLSGPLSCPAFEHLGSQGPSPGAVAICAGQIGGRRDFYTTAQTVADIEAVRRAGGYEKLVLYGTSYGTKVAEQYAQAYPSRIEALILDSVVAPNGPEALNLSTFAAIPHVLRALCAFGACAHITHNPVRDLDRLVRRLRRRPQRVRVHRGGLVRSVRIGPSDVLGILIEGDLDPRLRVAFPAAVKLALRNDEAPLGLLALLARGEAESETESLAEGFDAPLYFATTCEETSFPFSRASSPAGRLHEALHALRALPAKAFAPFGTASALDLSDIPVCARWPYLDPAHAVARLPLPAVPALILSGAEDLRTPTSSAREVAREIPGSHLLVVPYTGHSVLGSDPSDCSRRALQALFDGRPIRACPARPEPGFLRPISLARESKAAGVH
jgi:pimeloyl-ACP methyl ester carboxylesterase